MRPCDINAVAIRLLRVLSNYQIRSPGASLESVRPTVVVDTNSIARTDWRLESATWRLMLAFARNGQIRLLVPEVVIIECLGTYRRAHEVIRRDLSKLRTKFDIDSICVEYEQHLRSTLVDAGAEIDAEPPIDLLSLVARAAMRKLPFNESGNGFRDSIIWMHALACSRASGPTVLITSDGDFLDKSNGQTQLHSQLSEEAEGEVEWYPNISACLLYTSPSPRDATLSRMPSSA